jgi:DnaK suppressor protein
VAHRAGLTHPVRMTEAQIRDFRDSLETKQSALEAVLWKREGIDVERSADPSDEAQFAVDRELKIRALEGESSVLAAVRSALQRIDDGEYGVCQSCDSAISAKRLAAIPWAPHCLACQEMMDQLPREEESFAA